MTKHSGYAVKMSRIAGVLRRTFGLVREHVGTDHFGNKYYVVPEQKTWTGKPCAKISLSECVYIPEPCRLTLIKIVSESSD